MLPDAEFIEHFESCTLRPDQFHHRDHVRLAFLYFQHYEPADAIARVTAGLRRFAASLGKSDRYHETVTWAFLLLIRERMARAECASDWDIFAAANEDLLDWKGNLLRKYYREETLESSLAKSTFLLPDRLASNS